MSSINAAILTIATSATGQSKPAASSKSSTNNTGVKSVDEQKSETKANEKEKAKAETENKNNEETSTQSKLGSQQIIASNLKALTPKPETNSTTGTLPKPVDTWKTKTSATGNINDNTQSSDLLNSGINGQSRMENMFSDMDKMIQLNSSDPKIVGEKYGIASPDQNQSSSSSSQQSQGQSGQGLGGGPGGNGSGGYFNNVVVGNNSGNIIGDTSLTGGGSVVEGAQTPTTEDVYRNDAINKNYQNNGNTET